MNEQPYFKVEGRPSDEDNSIDRDAEIAYKEMLQEAQNVVEDENDEFASAFDNTNAVESSAVLQVDQKKINLTDITCRKPNLNEHSKAEPVSLVNNNGTAELEEKTNYCKPVVGDKAKGRDSKSPQETYDVQAQSANAFSPSHSVCSHPSSTSSEPSWPTDLRTSLPHDRRVKPHKTMSLEEAKEEWEHVETVTVGSKAEGYCSPMVSIQEAVTYFQAADLQAFSSKIRPTIRRSGFSSLWHMLSGPPNIASSLKSERDLVFILGLCPFDNQDNMHSLILQTVYKKLTTTTLDCPRYGTHWENVGFQGEDPSTDLRGCGMLGLLNILFLCTDPKTQMLCHDIYRLSQDEEQNFPFCVMGINITRIALQVLREGKLNKECNQRNTVFDVFHELYAGIYMGIYRLWRSQQKTISDSGFVLRDIETSAKKNPLAFCKQLHKTVQERSKLSESPAGPKAKGAANAKVDKFSGICDGDNDEEEEVHLV